MESILFETQENGCTIKVSRVDQQLHLWFDAVKQSQLLIDMPTQLITPYEQAMAAWQLFAADFSASDSIVILGLGAGSATQYLHAHYPLSPIQVIESSETVVKLAYQYFGLPKAANVTVQIDDALRWLAKPDLLAAQKPRLLAIDLFDVQAQHVYQYSAHFFAQCLAIMQSNTVLVINLWASELAAFKSVLQHMGQVFAWRLLVLPVQASANVIVFAFHPDAAPYALTALQQIAATNAASTQLPLSEYLQTLLLQNQAQLGLCIQDDTTKV